MLRRFFRAHFARTESPSSPAESVLPSVANLDDMIPDAESASYVGGGSTELFREIGDELVGWFKLHAELRPEEKVLDVGCGIGRVAIPLTQYLTRGTYRKQFNICAKGLPSANLLCRRTVVGQTTRPTPRPQSRIPRIALRLCSATQALRWRA